MEVERDPYRVIGVPPIANDSEIKKAYRQKSKMYHPDLNPDIRIWADEKMKELVEAYNIVSEPEKKKAYDMTFHLQYRRERKKKKKKKQSQEKTFMDKLKIFFLLAPKDDKQAKKTLPKGKKSKKKEIEYNPKEADIHFGLGVSMCDNNAFLDQTIDSFRKATLYDPEHVESHYNLGLALYRQGDWGEASTSFQKVLKIEPADEGAKHMLKILKEDVY